MLRTRKRASDAVRWVFDPVPPSGARQGGTPAAYIFNPNLDAFVREILQNSHDQRSGKKSAVNVEFALHSLTGRRRERFLRAIAWDDLLPHLEDASQGPSRLGERIGEALERIDNEALVVLQISDGGANGLTGDEDDPNGNFNGLCRNVLYSPEDRPGRGGSHGLGKAVLWRFSSVATVLFSSRLNERQRRFRVFGRTELPHHGTDTGEWSGPGWLGLPDRTHAGERAASVLQADPPGFAADALLTRDDNLGTGTTILVVGFFEPSVDEPRPLAAVAADLLASATRWFWPSISLQSIAVAASVHENGRQTWRDEAAVTSEVLPFQLALAASSVSTRAVEQSQVAERTLSFRIPAMRAYAGHGSSSELEARINLRLIRSGEVEETDPWRNTIALVRGAGMVVKYWRPTRLPLEGGLFHAVLRAGQAHGSTAEDLALEAFLRTAEPPSHNDWVASTDQMQARYARGAATRLNSLWQQLNNAIVEMTEEEAPDRHPGPLALARLFPLGSAGGGRPEPRQFTITFSDASLSSGVWRVAGDVHRLKTDGAWQVRISVQLEGESGRGDRIAIDDIRILDGSCGTTRVTPDGYGVLEIGENAPDVSYELTTSSAPEELLDRTRIRVDVRPSMRRDDGA